MFLTVTCLRKYKLGWQYTDPINVHNSYMKDHHMMVIKPKIPSFPYCKTSKWRYLHPWVNSRSSDSSYCLTSITRIHHQKYSLIQYIINLNACRRNSCWWSYNVNRMPSKGQFPSRNQENFLSPNTSQKSRKGGTYQLPQFIYDEASFHTLVIKRKILSLICDEIVYIVY